MNPGFDHLDHLPLELSICDVLERIPGTDGRDPLELIYTCARKCGGIVVLDRPTARAAAAAVLGALVSRSNHGPLRVYLADRRIQRLKILYGELSEIDLACDITLYHGSLKQFFRDFSLNADLICTDFRELEPGGFESYVSSGSVVLDFDDSTESDHANAQYLVDAGMLELEARGPGGSVYRATRHCHGQRFVPRTGLRVELQGKLHARYLLSETTRDAVHTPIADLAEDIRREFIRSFPGEYGSRPWPYSRPESRGLSLRLPSGKPWPKISIVTPTRNQGQYIEETILSVFHQDYPNVEHIVVDGASTDETPSILERYRDRIAIVISEPDKGQSQAINKGMSKATGEILTWLNGDDMLAPGALEGVALAFDVHRPDMIAGICRLYRDGSLESQHLTCCADGPLLLEDLLDLDQCWHAGQFFIQPEVMFTREIWLRAGGRVNEQLHYTMDYELWLRFAQAGARLHVIGRPVAWFRLHEEQKISDRSNVVLELTACRNAFLKENDLKPKSDSRTPQRQELRIAVLHEGDSQELNINHLRLARTLAWAGHEIRMVPVQDAPWRKGLWEGLLDRVSATGPDLVVVCDRNSLNTDSQLSLLLVKCFRTIVITSDTLAYGSSVQSIRWSSPSDVFRPRNKQACREELGLPIHRFLILLAPAGDQAVIESRALLEGLAGLELPNAAVVTTDPPAVRGPMEVITLGRINDARRAALVNSAVDIVVALTATETLEQVCIEAMACGTPVAGYPGRGVSNAIPAGVTGLLASDNQPTSLTAVVHHLAINHGLRSDLAKWGRLYAENEWSEFSGYRQIFLALSNLGLVKSLKLRRQIEFLSQAPRILGLPPIWTDSSNGGVAKALGDRVRPFT